MTVTVEGDSAAAVTVTAAGEPRKGGPGTSTEVTMPVLPCVTRTSGRSGLGRGLPVPFKFTGLGCRRGRSA